MLGYNVNFNDFVKKILRALLFTSVQTSNLCPSARVFLIVIIYVNYEHCFISELCLSFSITQQY